MAFTPANPNGQATMANSGPVVLASDQTTNNPVPVFAAGAGFTRPGDTTAYSTGDLIANSTTAGSVALDTASVAKVNDQTFTIIRCRLTKSTNSLTNALFRIHIYNVAAPTFANGDNGVWSSSGFANYLGSFDINMDRAFTDGNFGVAGPTLGTVLIGAPISGARTIAYAVEARAAYTPGNAEVFKAYFEVA